MFFVFPFSEIPGSTMDIQFSIINMNMSDIKQQSEENVLRDQLVVEVNITRFFCLLVFQI